jgi:zinc-finger of transposase IS204/IS1001/IS1096/IS1165
MNTVSLFTDPNLLQVERVSSEPEQITLTVKTEPRPALCPRCHSPSNHLHSRYARRLADLPWFGVAVRVEVHARRLYCRHVECPQRIFCERIPTFVAPYARRTFRLNEALQLIGLAVGGEAGCRGSHRLGDGESNLRNLVREIRTLGSVRGEGHRRYGEPKRARSWKRRIQPRKYLQAPSAKPAAQRAR